MHGSGFAPARAFALGSPFAAASAVAAGGRAHEARLFAERQGRAIQRTPALRSRSSGQLARAQVRQRGCISFGDFSLGTQRKVTRSPAGEWNALLRNVTRKTRTHARVAWPPRHRLLLRCHERQLRKAPRRRPSARHARSAGQAKTRASAHGNPPDQRRAEEITSAKEERRRRRPCATQELKIAATAKELRALDQKLVAQQDKLAQLEAQRDALDANSQTPARGARGAAAFGLRARPQRGIAPAAGAGRCRLDRPHARVLPLFRARARRRDRALC